MKKIALVLILALAFTSIASATDVVVGGWLDFRGEVVTATKEGATDEEKKAKVSPGNTEWEVSVAATGEGWGARVGMDMWQGKASPEGTAGTTNNTYIYADFNDAVRLWSGIRMQPVMYTAWPAVESFNALLADNNGLGLGAYNYGGHSKWGINDLVYVDYAGKFSGLALELKPGNGFEAAVLYRNNTAGKNFEDSVKDDITLNAKYAMDMGTFYAGYILKDKELNQGFGNAFWVEADLKLVENLTSGIKFEMLDADGELYNIGTVAEPKMRYATKVSAITVNLAYNIPEAAKFALQSTTLLTDKDKTGNSYVLVNSLSIAPVVPVVNPTLFAYFNKGSEEKTTAYGFKLNIGKSIGNTSNNIWFAYEGDDTDAKNAKTSFGYKTTCWF